MNNKFLKYYLQNGFLDKKGSLLSLLFPKTINSSAAKKVLIQLDKTNHHFTPNKTVSITPYNGSNLQANNIKSLLANAKSISIIAAVVHGSIASNEIIPYSDFDGILILDDTKIAKISELLLLRELIIASEKEMRQIDSLQHHGWHILLKSELTDYNDASLPILLIEEGKLLFPSNSIELKININPLSQEYSKGFTSLKNSIVKKLNTNNYITNFYSFKNFISEILLIPAMYYQAINNKPINKKDSFDWLKSNLTSEQYLFFHELSELRLIWNQESVHLKNEYTAERFKAVRFISLSYRTKLPVKYKEWLTPANKTKLLAILNFMSQNILLKNT